MAKQSRIQRYQPLKERRFEVPDTVDANWKEIEAPSVTNSLWRQIDRWVNEGGAVRDNTAP
jgi:hypothetical protein